MEKNLIGITTGWMCYLVTVCSLISFIFVKSSHVPASFPVNFHLHVSLFKNQCLQDRISTPNLLTLAAKKIHRSFVVAVLCFVLLLFLKYANSMISKEKIHGR